MKGERCPLATFLVLGLLWKNMEERGRGRKIITGMERVSISRSST